MDNNQQPDGIWVNRAEYDRLKQAETERLYPTPKVIGSEPFVEGQVVDTGHVTKNTTAERVKLIVIGVLAVLSFIYPAFLILFIFMGLAVMMTKEKTGSELTVSRVVKVLLIAAAAPFVGIAVLFAMIMVSSGGKSA